MCLLINLARVIGPKAIWRRQIKQWGRKLICWNGILPLVILLRSGFDKLLAKLLVYLGDLAGFKLWLGHSVVTPNGYSPLQIRFLVILLVLFFVFLIQLFNSDWRRFIFCLLCTEANLIYFLFKFVEVCQQIVDFGFLFAQAILFHELLDLI